MTTTTKRPSRRLTRTAGGTTTQFLSSGNQIYLEAVGGTTTAVYTYGNALIRKDGEFPLFDALGSERTATDSTQTVTATTTSDAFGVPVASTGSSTNPYTFAATSGYRNDGDAGLAHVGARYYDAQVGRFATRDTDLKQSPYLYCEHDPVNATDPSGHEGWNPKEIVHAGWVALWGGIGTVVGTVVGGAGGGTTVPVIGVPPGGVVGMIAGSVAGACIGEATWQAMAQIRPYIPPDNPFGYGQGGY